MVMYCNYHTIQTNERMTKMSNIGKALTNLYNEKHEEKEVTLVLDELVTGETELEFAMEDVDANWRSISTDPVEAVENIFPDTWEELLEEIKNNWIDWQKEYKTAN